MKILKPHRYPGWITAKIAGHVVEAKVYDNPFSFGIDGGRVCKLAIYKGSQRRPNMDCGKQLCYYYDRGLDFDCAPKGLLKKVLKELNTLPPLFP